MKKLVTLLLLALMLVCTTASAEEIDFSAMSTDALLALREQLNAEINARLGDDTALIGDGVFVAGVDIVPGTYNVTCAAAFDDREFYVNLFQSKEDYQTYDANRRENEACRFFQATLLPGGMTTINLTEGMTIEIYNGIGRMIAVQPDWAP